MRENLTTELPYTSFKVLLNPVYQAAKAKVVLTSLASIE